MSEEKQPLKFPMEFKKCPCCGSERRFAEEVGEQAKREIGWDDPRIPIIARPQATFGKFVVIKAIALLDVCLDCGAIYAKALYAEKELMK